MSPADRTLLEELLRARGPSGQEDEVAPVAQRALKEACGNCEIDAAGNLLSIVRAEKAEQDPVMIVAHQDEVALAVKRIDPDGRLAVVPVGGIEPVNYGTVPVEIIGQKEVINGVLSLGTLHGTVDTKATRDAMSGKMSWEDLRVQTRRSPEALRDCGIRPGSRVVLHRAYRQLFDVEDTIAAHFLDDRALIISLVQLARRLKDNRARLKRDVYLAVSVQEEMTNAGALFLARKHEVETLVALEVGPVAAEYGTSLDGGPIIVFSDEKGSYDKSLSDELVDLAVEAGLEPQAALMPGFASDASAAGASGLVARAAVVAA
ncbi:MAG TPA: hypothetical protein VE224_16135, partial [Pseudolabrys sp.]|nr:hypothetical protein [Pseudolabrys sp.]